jgi:hypothetical protein
MSTKIIVDRFYGKIGENNHVSRYLINGTISNEEQDIPVTEIFYDNDGSVLHTFKQTYDTDGIIDEFFSTRENVVGEHSKIYIESLSSDDLDFLNKLFSNNYEIPDCVEFKVSPNIQLTNLPKIKINTEEKEICPICLEDLYNGESVSYISGNKPGVKYCNHKFHTKCINEHCSRNDNCVCPLCRQKIEYGSIRQLGGRRMLKRKSLKRKRKSLKRKSLKRKSLKGKRKSLKRK